MPSKLAFLLNLKHMRNLSIYKCVFSILSVTVQQSEPQPSRGMKELSYQGLCVWLCRFFPVDGQLMAAPFPVHTKVGPRPNVALATYTWIPKYKVQ